MEVAVLLFALYAPWALIGIGLLLIVFSISDLWGHIGGSLLLLGLGLLITTMFL